MFKITRSTQQKDTVTHSLYFERGYAHFTLVPALGVVHAQTDWGDYTYRWSSIGSQSLEEFLIDIDTSYAAIKFCGKPAELDLKTTVAMMKRDLFTRRKEKAITADLCRYLYDELQSAFEDDPDTAPEFVDMLPNDLILELYDADYSSIPIEKRYTAWQEIFVHEVFPAFQDYLRLKLELT